MANSRVGIKRILLANSGTLSSTPLGWVLPGIRKPSALVIKGLDELVDYRGRQLRNKVNFKYECDSYQLRLRDLQLLLGFVQNGYDIQIVKEKQGAGAASGGIFNFLTSFNGLDFEYFIGNKDRYTKITFETAMEYANAITAFDAADSGSTLTPAISGVSISGGNEKGENFSNYAYPWYFSIEAPDTTALFNKKEIIERSFSLKTKGIKNEYNETVVNWITVELKIKGSDATITKIVELLSKSISPTVTVKEYLTSTLYEKFTFAANVLTATPEFQLGDESDYAQLTFKADVSIDQFAFAYGTASGGTGSTTTVDEAEGTTEAQARTGGTLALT